MALTALPFLVVTATNAQTLPGSPARVVSDALERQPYQFCVDLPPASSGTLLKKRFVRATNATSEARERLQALASAGILRAGEIRDGAQEFELSDFGWQQQDSEDKRCLPAGKLEVGSVDLRESALAGTGYAGKAEGKVSKLPAWIAANDAVRQLPEVQRILSGVPLNVFLGMERGQWRVSVQPVPVAGRPPVRLVTHSTLYGDPAAGEPSKLSLPEITAAWRATSDAFGYPCLHLTNDQFPVDEGGWRDRFFAGIYEMLERTPKEQKVLSATLPRLDALVRHGILTATPAVGPKRTGGKLPGTAYEVAPAFTRYWNSRAGCLELGKVRVEATAVRKYQFGQDQFRLRQVVDPAEPWARNEELSKALPDLRVLVVEGVLCEGIIDRGRPNYATCE